MSYPAVGWVSQAAIQARRLPVNEIFGPTIQGEGPHTGHRCYFVRLGGCNLHCSWCDTPYTWDPTRYDLAAENPEMDWEEIIAKLRDLGAIPGDVVVLSGGEPLIHHHRLHGLLHPDFRWHVESNGTIPPPRWWADVIAHTTLSPKIHDQGDPEKRRLKPKALRKWADLTLRGVPVVWKFVVDWRQADYLDRDLAVIDHLVADYGLPHQAVWLMPLGTTRDDVLAGQKRAGAVALDRGYNLTTRLHTLLWGDERGR